LRSAVSKSVSKLFGCPAPVHCSVTARWLSRQRKDASATIQNGNPSMGRSWRRRRFMAKRPHGNDANAPSPANPLMCFGTRRSLSLGLAPGPNPGNNPLGQNSKQPWAHFCDGNISNSYRNYKKVLVYANSMNIISMLGMTSIFDRPYGK